MRRLRSLLFLLWWVAILVVMVGSLLPQLAPPSGNLLDKYIHVAAYAGLTLLGLPALSSNLARGGAVVMLLALGIAIEWLQGLSGGREASALDVLANAVGILAGLAVFALCVTRIPPFRAWLNAPAPPRPATGAKHGAMPR